MKKSMIFGILFLSSMLLVSCGKSPQEKIVGEWVSSEFPGVVTFNSDGTAINLEGETGKWELSGDEEPFKLIVMYDGDSEVVNLTFISDDEIKIESGGRKHKLKRKGSK
tara:strand:- start:86 stop:412 length:327 start_codon:yes stop_codon:yes gene_type:complete